MIRILGIDPGTTAAGVSVVRFDPLGRPALEAYLRVTAKAKAKDSDTATRERISLIVEQLVSFLWKQSDYISAVAYERPFHRGEAATSGLLQSVGAILNHPAFSGKTVIPVYGATVKAVQRQAGTAFAAVPDSAAQRAKRDALKATAIAWFTYTFGLELPADESEAADATAVAIGAFNAWQRRQPSTTPLLGRGSRGPRKAAKT